MIFILSLTLSITASNIFEFNDNDSLFDILDFNSCNRIKSNEETISYTSNDDIKIPIQKNHLKFSKDDFNDNLDRFNPLEFKKDLVNQKFRSSTPVDDNEMPTKEKANRYTDKKSSIGLVDLTKSERNNGNEEISSFLPINKIEVPAKEKANRYTNKNKKSHMGLVDPLESEREYVNEKFNLLKTLRDLCIKNNVESFVFQPLDQQLETNKINLREDDVCVSIDYSETDKYTKIMSIKKVDEKPFFIALSIGKNPNTNISEEIQKIEKNPKFKSKIKKLFSKK